MDQLEQYLEGLRKKAVNATVLPIILIVLGVICFIVFPPIGLILFVVGIILLAASARKVTRAFTDAYKHNLIRAVLSEVFTDVTLEPGRGISKELAKSVGMINTGDRFTSNDLITAKYKDVPFVQSDVHIEVSHTDSEGHTHYSTIFRGRWMIFRFNKEFSCDLQVVSSGFSATRRKGGIFSRKEDRMPKVELENAAFNKVFTVYANSQHEAFYILTPHIMDALLSLRKGMNAPMMLMFYKGELHVAADTRSDAFEPKIFSKLDLARDRERALADIAVITAFADSMRLNNDIYRER